MEILELKKLLKNYSFEELKELKSHINMLQKETNEFKEKKDNTNLNYIIKKVEKIFSDDRVIKLQKILKIDYIDTENVINSLFKIYKNTGVEIKHMNISLSPFYISECLSFSSGCSYASYVFERALILKLFGEDIFNQYTVFDSEKSLKQIEFFETDFITNSKNTFLKEKSQKNLDNFNNFLKENFFSITVSYKDKNDIEYLDLLNL